MVLLLSVNNKLIIPLCFFLPPTQKHLQMSRLEMRCLGEGETVHRHVLVFTKISAGKDLAQGRREREEEKRKRSPLFKMKYPKVLLLVQS